MNPRRADLSEVGSVDDLVRLVVALLDEAAEALEVKP